MGTILGGWGSYLITCGMVKPLKSNVHADLHGLSRPAVGPSSRVDLCGRAGEQPGSQQRFASPGMCEVMVL